MLNDGEADVIAYAITKGFTDGYAHSWKLKLIGVEQNDLTEIDKEHIANAIINGYKEGEVIIDSYNTDKNGWWKLDINECR